MVERNRLEQAITDLEAQRAVLGDAVVDTTVAALREKVAALQTVADERPPRRTAQRKQVSILFAHVEGFTGLVQSIDDTDRLDVMNLLWRRLDGTITEHGGTIDKHVGNAVMGLFGVPVAHEHDPERAVRTALAMRAVLSDFVSEITAEENARAVDPTPRTGADETLPLHGLRLRIGINTGPVLLGEVGTGDEYTVIGDAVNVASRLERAAPPGGILISHDTYLLVRDVFNVEPLGPVEIKGKSDPVLVYMVLG